MGKRLVFDFETEPFSDEFYKASSPAARLKHAPKLRIGGVYDEANDSYTFYEPADAPALIAHLKGADEIVSFNGRNFDLLVLSRHHGLSATDRKRLNAKHHDLLEIVVGEIGFRVSLNNLAQRNLGERKMVGGKEMANLDITTLAEACCSDISQTHRLYLKWLNGTLDLPRNMQRHDDIFEDLPLIHHHLPPGRYMTLDLEDMTEGQMAEYLAGTWGVTEDGEFVEM
jgi:hypothetical protein